MKTRMKLAERAGRLLFIAATLTVAACGDSGRSPVSPGNVNDFSMNAQPFVTVVHIDPRQNDTTAPVTLDLDAGSYTVVPIGISEGASYDAWTPWATTTCTQPAGCVQTAPTTVTGWKSAYVVMSPALTSVGIAGVAPVRVTSTPAGAAGFRDYLIVTPETTRYHVNEPIVYPDAVTSLAAARTSSFTLEQPARVGFSIHDIRPLADNRGGISLRVARE